MILEILMFTVRMTMSYCITIYLRYFVVPIVFLVSAFLLLLCNY